MARENKLIVVVGPTAVGKTTAAIHLASRLNTEIISADSRQLFKELTIGTAKPTLEELAAVPHHFINYKSIEEDYDAATYGEEAYQLIVRLFQQHETLVLCGGSGLYVKALLEGFDEMPEIPEGLREAITHDFHEKGLVWLQEEMRNTDPEYFAQVDTQNPQRLMRGLEIVRASGKPVMYFRKRNKKVLPFQVVKYGLELPREVLYARIDARVDEMIRSGLEEEAAQFYSRKELNALQTVGYQELFGWMDGHYDRDEAIRLLKRNTRHYAKRQLTWFKRDEEISWMSPEQLLNIEKL
ncbi:MAG: tRNA (adenosine(37)-N6)-dimethylallyltransferase MiaA [Cyclobacteriaceae bacterium]|nr:tRNA (adenosine(37)-N6)-dimethylallyltransferase MiaA [Cyclobacteriaceae bacterium]